MNDWFSTVAIRKSQCHLKLSEIVWSVWLSWTVNYFHFDPCGSSPGRQTYSWNGARHVLGLKREESKHFNSLATVLPARPAYIQISSQKYLTTLQDTTSFVRTSQNLRLDRSIIILDFNIFSTDTIIRIQTGVSVKLYILKSIKFGLF